MRAIVMKEYGGPECLVPAERPDPVAKPGWALVRLRTAALNWHDVLVRQGRYQSPLPHVPGADGAGTDAETGEDVLVMPSLWWGDGESAPGPSWEILGDHRPGTYAEMVRVPRECVVPKPSRLSWPEAAALPLVGLTTYRALFPRARLVRGESLLVLGAGGGVATMAVSLASAVGCTVVVTSSSPHKVSRSRELGASAGVLYGDPSWPQAARELSPGGRGFDVVLDSIGTWQQSIGALRPGGRLVVLGASRAERANLDVRRFYFGQFDLLGTTMGSTRDFAGLLAVLDAYDVPPPVVDRTFPLDEAAAAHAYLETGAGFGKVVLTIARTPAAKARAEERGPMTGRVRYEVDDRGAAFVTLDAPESRNALSDELLDDLLDAFERARTDDAVRVAVLTSSHDRVFSAGGDLKAFTGDAPTIGKYAGLDRFPRLYKLIGGLGKPVICAANGDVLAGAFGLALACDLVIAREGVRFGCPEINVGVFPFMISALIYRNIDRMKANELMMLGEPIDAAEAHRLNIVNAVVPAASFDKIVREWAHKVAGKSPLLMRLGKNAIDATRDMSLPDALEALRAQLALAFTTEDLAEGVAAFREKREAVWKIR